MVSTYNESNDKYFTNKDAKLEIMYVHIFIYICNHLSGITDLK